MDCLICTDDLNESLLICGHGIHIKCVANTGKTKCPLCKADVIIPDEYHEILNKKMLENEDYIENQNFQAAQEIQAAQESIRERIRDREPIRERESVRIIGHNLVRCVIRHIPEFTRMSLFEELVHLNYAESNSRITTDHRVFGICEAIYSIKEHLVLYDDPTHISIILNNIFYNNDRTITGAYELIEIVNTITNIALNDMFDIIVSVFDLN
jgi:hypothetical protein